MHSGSFTETKVIVPFVLDLECAQTLGNRMGGPGGRQHSPGRIDGPACFKATAHGIEDHRLQFRIIVRRLQSKMEHHQRLARLESLAERVALSAGDVTRQSVGIKNDHIGPLHLSRIRRPAQRHLGSHRQPGPVQRLRQQGTTPRELVQTGTMTRRTGNEQHGPPRLRRRQRQERAQPGHRSQASPSHPCTPSRSSIDDSASVSHGLHPTHREKQEQDKTR